jgi:hypothetical protein
MLMMFRTLGDAASRLFVKGAEAYPSSWRTRSVPPPMRKFSAVDAVQRVVLWQTFAIWRDAVTDNSSSKVTRDASFAPPIQLQIKITQPDIRRQPFVLSPRPLPALSIEIPVFEPSCHGRDIRKGDYTRSVCFSWLEVSNAFSPATYDRYRYDC